MRPSLVVVASLFAVTAGCGNPPSPTREISRFGGGGGYPSVGWSGWEDLGEFAAWQMLSPAVVSRDGQPHIFYRGGDGSLAQQWSDGSSWHTSSDSDFSPQALTAVARGRELHVFYWDGKSYVHVVDHGDGGGYGGYETLPFVDGHTGPAAATMIGSGRFARDRFDVFVVGNSPQGPAVYQATQQGSGGWTGWTMVPETDNADWMTPAAVSSAAGRIDLVYTARDRQAHHHYFEGGRWQSGLALDGEVIGAPTIAARGPHRLELFVGRADGLVQFHGDGTSWRGGDAANRRAACVHQDPYRLVAPSAYATGANRIDLVVVGRDRRLWHDVYGLFPDGGANAPSCDCESAGESCGDGRVCDGTTWPLRCVGCGASGNSCCAGGGCQAGDVCSDGICVVCGARGEACCGGDSACSDGSACDGSRCVCGAIGQTCCAGSVCDDGVCGGDNRCAPAPSFASDIYPLLSGSVGGYQCAACHAAGATWPHAPRWLGSDASSTYANLVGDGFVTPGDPALADAPLYGDLASGMMPLKSDMGAYVPFRPADLDLLKRWIRGGAKP